MANTSLAAQAVARGPQTVAPPSFAGEGWLVATNLAAMTTGFLVALMIVVLLGNDWWKHRHLDRRFSPAWIWRLIGLCFSCAITIRCGAEALNLWGWNPRDPVTTGGFLYAKRIVDPIAVGLGVTGLVLFVLSLPGLMRQLRREPFPVDLWQSWPIVRRMAALAVLTALASVAVVSLR